MGDVVWTKTHDLKIGRRLFRVFVSEQTGGGFDASCLWYDQERMLRTPEQDTFVEFFIEQRHARSEEEAMRRLLEWVVEKFGSAGTLSAAYGHL